MNESGWAWWKNDSPLNMPLGRWRFFFHGAALVPMRRLKRFRGGGIVFFFHWDVGGRLIFLH